MASEGPRHATPDRAFHWLMAILVLILLGTAFLPILGLKFNWVPTHWVSGVLLIIAVIFHIYRGLIVHGIGSMFPNRKDLQNFFSATETDQKYDLNQMYRDEIKAFFDITYGENGLIQNYQESLELVLQVEQIKSEFNSNS